MLWLARLVFSGVRNYGWCRDILNLATTFLCNKVMNSYVMSLLEYDYAQKLSAIVSAFRSRLGGGQETTTSQGNR